MNALATTHQLFPIIQSQVTGLARLAQESAWAADGHQVEFRTLKVRSILNKSVSRRQLSLAWSINPYRGCEFGCRYCYARYTHEFLLPQEAQAAAEPVSAGQALDRFESLIFLKENAAWLLDQEIRRMQRREKGAAEEIALGTATDPYQPIERTARVTREILEVMSRKSGLRLGIITKSRLIERDVDLLVEIARHNTLVVHITITTTDDRLARILEPRAPRPELRFRAVERLRAAGITTGILCSPLLPGITDNREAIGAVARRAAAARASFFAAEPLFLKACSRPAYLGFIHEHFTHLEADHRSRFADRDFADAPYRAHLQQLVRDACKRYNLAERSTDALLTREPGRKPIVRVAVPAQRALFA